MTPPTGKILKGDALDWLRLLPSASVQCIVTSPPYWGLRDYGHAGQIGLEETLPEHIARVVGVMREARRVLRPDGTLWMNYGDAYATSGYKAHGSGDDVAGWDAARNGQGARKTTGGGVKAKDLLLLPARVALALQEDGWWLRSEIIWAKPNPMPESVTDRPTRSHETLYLLTRKPRYFYDAAAVREGYAESSLTDKRGNDNGHRRERDYPGAPSNGGTNLGGNANGGRNLRSVWTIPTQAYPGSHYATFPEKLVERCLRAGTSERGACPACGAPWVREVESKFVKVSNRSLERKVLAGSIQDTGNNKGMGFNQIRTTGWHPGCACEAGAPVPCVVLDMFAGSGTTGVVAYRLGRRFVGLDLGGGDIDHGGWSPNDRLRAAALGVRDPAYAADLAYHRHAEQAGQLNMLEVRE